MNKLKLNADDPHVEAFRLQADVVATRGTVRGLDSADVTAPCCYGFVVYETRPAYR